MSTRLASSEASSSSIVFTSDRINRNAPDQHARAAVPCRATVKALSNFRARGLNRFFNPHEGSFGAFFL
jgi:hypothetical protein